MVFAGGLACPGVEDGFHPLADATESPEAFLLVSTVGSDQVRAEFLRDEPFEFTSGEAFVADDQFAGAGEEKCP